MTVERMRNRPANHLVVVLFKVVFLIFLKTIMKFRKFECLFQRCHGIIFIIIIYSLF